MPSWCLIKAAADDFKSKLKDGTIDPIKMAAMSSEDRHAFLSKIVGEENATHVNSLFESKLLLKNQQTGFVSWAKRVSGISPQIRRDLLSKIERMDQVLNPSEQTGFLHDLAQTKLGTEVTQEEAKRIVDFSKQIQDSRTKITDEMPIGSKERMNYGVARVLLNDYVNELKVKNGPSVLQRYMNPLNAVSDLAGLSKSVLASFDNSFFGRQGIKTLLDFKTSPIWMKNFAKSWVDAAKELGGKDAMIPIKADINSRPNALNGKYAAGKFDLGLSGEEAYPTALPGKVPLLGRLYKASESAFNGAALRMRADLADRVIAQAERSGINTLDPKEAESLGKLVNSMTGRGSTGLTASQSSMANNIFFSVKFLKSNFDTLTAHVTDPNMSGYAKRQAAKSLLRTATTLAGIYTLANTLSPGSAETDQASPNFGKIKVFGQWTDVTGGMGAMAHLASTLVPTNRNGQWGFWTKNSQGQLVKLNSGKYGAQTALDVLDSFWQGKLSPMAGIIRDVWKGKDFQGNVPSVGSVVQNASEPLPFQTFESLMKDPNSSNVLGSLILDGLGFSINPKNPAQTGQKWDQNTNATLDQFRQTVGDQKFQEANNDFNSKYNSWLSGMKNDTQYNNLSTQGQQSLQTQMKAKIQNEVFSQYGYKSTKQIDTPQQKQEKQTIKQIKQTSSVQEVQDIAQAVLDAIVKPAEASNGSQPQGHDIMGDLFGSDKITIENGQQTDEYKPGLVQNAFHFVTSLFSNGKQPVSPEGSTKSENLPAPVHAPEADHQAAVKSPNPPSQGNKVDFGQFQADQNGAKRKNFTPSQPPQDIADIVKKYFPDNYSQAILVAATENAQYDPTRPDNVNPTDGSHDRGIFQINSNTFNGLTQRAGAQLKQAGINSYEDMYDPQKNAFVARLIQQGAKQYTPDTNPNGWGGWFGWQDTGYNLNNGWYSAPDRIAYETSKK